MQKKTISVPKTARYFMLGDPGEQIDTLWIVCHGYGQLASSFLKKFQVLENKNTLIVAPEGLHRFYWEKFSGKVVASWMTKEDREEDIKDYITYLDLVYRQIRDLLPDKNIKVVGLGFSQGVSTICRWVASKEPFIHHLILWAGSLPKDIPISPAVFSLFKTYYVAGVNDEFIQEEQLKETEQFLIEKKLNFEILRFQGNHTIDETTLVALAGKI